MAIKSAKKTTTRRKVSKNIESGKAHIHSSFNNTIVTISDVRGNVLSWASAGELGFKGSRKEYTICSRRSCRNSSKSSNGTWLKNSRSICKKALVQDESAIRALQTAGLEISSIKRCNTNPT